MKQGLLPLGGNQETTEASYVINKMEEVFDIKCAGLETQVNSLVGQFCRVCFKMNQSALYRSTVT